MIAWLFAVLFQHQPKGQLLALIGHISRSNLIEYAAAVRLKIGYKSSHLFANRYGFRVFADAQRVKRIAPMEAAFMPPACILRLYLEPLPINQRCRLVG